MMKLSIVIVSFNQFGLLRRVIEAVRKSRLPFENEIIVVDNGSEGAGTEFADVFYRGIVAIQNKENIGFGQANNMGVAASCGSYILFLNNDATTIL